MSDTPDDLVTANVEIIRKLLQTPPVEIPSIADRVERVIIDRKKIFARIQVSATQIAESANQRGQFAAAVKDDWRKRQAALARQTWFELTGEMIDDAAIEKPREVPLAGKRAYFEE